MDPVRNLPNESIEDFKTTEHGRRISNGVDLKQEKKLWNQGYKVVAGLDEAGRGALCGPVVAAAVVLKNPKSTRSFDRVPRRMTGQIPKELREVNDSKKLSPKKREELYEVLINHPLVEWEVGRVGPKVIDRINILEATKLAMKRAVKNLKSKVESQRSKVDFIILDGKMNLDLKIDQKSIVRADEKVFSCAAASIIAKVTRDRAMNRYHKKYPQYDFLKHKGYGTKYHIKMIKKYGPCEIHRMTFEPIKTQNFRLRRIVAKAAMARRRQGYGGQAKLKTTT